MLYGTGKRLHIMLQASLGSLNRGVLHTALWPERSLFHYIDMFGEWFWQTMKWLWQQHGNDKQTTWKCHLNVVRTSLRVWKRNMGAFFVHIILYFARLYGIIFYLKRLWIINLLAKKVWTIIQMAYVLGWRALLLPILLCFLMWE
jgi:hypothetical protein